MPPLALPPLNLSASSSARASQDGSQLTARGSGDITFGGGGPKWLWPVVTGLVLVLGWVLWKKLK